MGAQCVLVQIVSYISFSPLCMWLRVVSFHPLQHRCPAGENSTQQVDLLALSEPSLPAIRGNHLKALAYLGLDTSK